MPWQDDAATKGPKGGRKVKPLLAADSLLRKTGFSWVEQHRSFLMVLYAASVSL